MRLPRWVLKFRRRGVFEARAGAFSAQKKGRSLTVDGGKNSTGQGFSLRIPKN